MNLRPVVLIVPLLLVSWVVLASPEESSRPDIWGEPPDEADYSYAVGFDLGFEVREALIARKVDADVTGLVDGFRDGLMNAEPRLTYAEIDELLYELREYLDERSVEGKLMEDAEFRALHDANLEKSRAFHAMFGRNEGVVTMDNGIQYKVLVEGDGATPSAHDLVRVTYKGMLTDGTIVSEGTEEVFPVHSVVNGAQIVLEMMPVGGKWVVALPPALAFGASGQPPEVGPNESIIGQIELLEIVQ